MEQFERSQRTKNDYSFEDKNFLGGGTFGVVYKSHDSQLDKEIAIKIVELKGNQQEYKNVQMLTTETIPYFVKYFGYFIEDQNLYILMEYCREGNLRKVIEDNIKNETSLSTKQIKNWITELMHALIFMERHKVTHNDIKPENILMNQNKSVLLADVGELQLADAYNTRSKRGGTGVYKSPERALDDAHSSTASDVW